MNIELDFDKIPLSVAMGAFMPDEMGNVLLAMNEYFIEKGLTEAQAAQAAQESFDNLREIVLKFALSISVLEVEKEINNISEKLTEAFKGLTTSLDKVNHITEGAE
ncbi:hypothetical protein [Lelliottia wanjuensis]|uniref:hypothetical protein n=1 Tax=Lelliottia wanjuensis TaxID=3050585 RepID=UPI00254D3B6E|nr:hypothetical protein [Lelliottia sp. V86_10]MDK9585874.1 hypothetical protein [Lelliottia sp. V86_10]